jgi:hypothetical protein
MSSSVGQDVQSLLSIRVLQKCVFFDPNQLTTRISPEYWLRESTYSRFAFAPVLERLR